MMPRVVIVGGGFGGLSTARELRSAPAQITLIDRKNHHLFQPLLYQVATAGLSPAAIATPIRSVLKNQKNTEVFMAEVTSLDLSKKLVWMGKKSVSYDYLVLGTGSWHSYFGHEEWEPFAPGLKSIEDATTIRRKILLAFEAAEIEQDPVKRISLLTFVLVGGGPTGAEMAGAIAELAFQALKSDFRSIDPRQTKIILIEASPRILASFPEDLSAKALKKLQRLGVHVLNRSRVESVDSTGVKIGGQKIEASTVIWCAGVKASPVGKWLGAETDHVGRVKVEPDLSIPNHPEVFVVGDSAHVMQDGKQLPGVAPVAMQEGKYVAKLIHAKILGKSFNAKFRYFNKGNLATVGRRFAVADLGHIRMSGMFAWLTWVVVHIYYLIGYRNRIIVLLEWAWAYLTFQRGARLITNGSLE